MRIMLVLVALGVIGAAGGALFVYSGVYNIAATAQHTLPVYHLLNVAMRRSVKSRSKDIVIPPLVDPALVDRGLVLYRSHCVQCHGAPGVAPEAFALGLTPAPANLVLTAREWPPAELFWTVKYGIKMSGMPAWKFRLGDDELWAVVAFLRIMPVLSPAQYAEMARAVSGAAAVPVLSAPVDEPSAVERGKVAIHQYACTTCHVIRGLAGAIHPVGPSLDGIGNRKYLAGVLPNTTENMVRWLRAPQEVAPLSAMPDLGVSERDARDIAAYLETLK
jgi:mono/diheme cytochrome c family protein